jgi:hypothetical protein
MGSRHSENTLDRSIQDERLRLDQPKGYARDRSESPDLKWAGGVV